MVMVQAEPSEAVIIYPVPRWSSSWAIPEVPVPESRLHVLAINYLCSVLLAWIASQRRGAQIERNLGIRWVPDEPRAGFAPDLCLLEPTLEGDLSSLCLWQPGHAPPKLAVEVVSKNHPYKDYVDAPERCAAAGIGELWVYDPRLTGPESHGGPQLLQVWVRDERGALIRQHAGAGPAHSPLLNAWLHPVATREPEEAKLRISDTRFGGEYWPTQIEQRDAEIEQRDAEIEQRDAEIDRLRAALARQSGPRE